jgi:hypothetical protein
VIFVAILYKPKNDKTDVFEKSSKISYIINSELERIRAKNGANYCAVYIAHNGKEMLDGKGLYYLDQTFQSDCITCKYEANLLQNLPASQFSFTIAFARLLRCSMHATMMPPECLGWHVPRVHVGRRRRVR